MATPDAPVFLQVNYSDWKWEKVWQYIPEAVTYRLTCPTGEIRYLKLTPADYFPSLQDEAQRMIWAAGYLPVPHVLDHRSDGRVRWLLTRELEGSDATCERWKAEPERLVAVLAGGLRQFHEAPVDECPFDFSLVRSMALVKERVAKGLIVPERDLHREFSHFTVEEAAAHLEKTRPRQEDIVVCHGDYCLPNILLVDWKVNGFIDLGELGLADRWWDIAVAAWSVTWNLGPGFEGLFYREYGVEPDHERISFYRLLYDLVS